MIKKTNLTQIAKGVGDLKDKATKISKDAAKTAGNVKGAISVGVKTGKVALEKAGQVVNKDTLSLGLDATSKGVDLIANGASVLADSMKKASKGIKAMSGKLKKS